MKKNLKRAVAVVMAVALAATPVVGKTDAQAATATPQTCVEVTESNDSLAEVIDCSTGWDAERSDQYRMTGDFDVTFDITVNSTTENASSAVDLFASPTILVSNDKSVSESGYGEYIVMRTDNWVQGGTKYTDVVTGDDGEEATNHYGNVQDKNGLSGNGWWYDDEANGCVKVGDASANLYGKMVNSNIQFRITRTGNEVKILEKFTAKDSTDSYDQWQIIKLDEDDDDAVRVWFTSDHCKFTINSYTKAATTLAVTPAKVTLKPEATAKLQVDIKNNDGTNTLEWESAGENVATVDSGTITAVAVGTTTITAKLGDLTATCEVTVVDEDIDIDSVTATASTKTLYAGSAATAQIESEYSPDNATVDATPSYVSSDTSVLTVDDEGIVTGISEGTATVTVTRGRKNATVEFTVKNASTITGAWWTAWTPSYQLKNNSIIEFELNVEGGSAIYHNFAAVFANVATNSETEPKADNYTGYSEYAVVRGDNWGWGGGNNNSKSGNPIVYEGGIADAANDAEFIELMKNATVKATIEKKANIITYIYTATGENGKSVTRTATVTEDTGVEDNEALYVFFASDTSTVTCANTHYYEFKTETEPTCTEAGTRTFACNGKHAGSTGCEEKIQVAGAAAKGHSTTKTEEVAADCGEEKDGCEAYYTCSDCGKNFKDEKGTEEISDLDSIKIPYAHKWVVNEDLSTATCLEAGNVYRKCSVCEKEQAGEAVDALGHDYGDWETTTAATCLTKGVETRTCTRKKCTAETEGHKETREIDPLGHTYGDWEITTPATCLAKGVKTQTCTNTGCTEATDGHQKTEEIAALGHSLTKVEAKEATTSAEGNIEYYTCQTCEKCFSDAEGTTEITKESTVIAKKENTESGGQQTQTPPAQDNNNSNTGASNQNQNQTTTDDKKEETTQVNKGTTATDTKTGASYKVTTAGDSGKAAVEYVKPTGKAAKATSITIPDTVTVNGVTCKVTSIKASAFANNKKVKTITVGKNITKIGKKAFYKCTKVKTIKIKSTKLTKKNIGKNAFKGINKKVKIKVPKSKLNAYKKLFRSKGLDKKVKIVKL